jgi:hypothetical protein
VTTCPNLKALFGDRYRIGHDPSAVTWGERADPWAMTLPCRGGVVIYPHGDGMLAVEIDYHRHLAKRVGAIPGIRLHQGGDRERTFLFPLELFDRVAELVKPRRRRRLSPEHREASRARLARYQFGRRGKTG